MVYTSHDGRSIKPEEINHQHLSNIYWFREIINKTPCDKWVWDRIKNEFGGEILPYRPKSSFISEIKYLDKMGYLIWKEVDGIKIADIVYGGHIVGEAYYAQEGREIIINKLLES